MSIFFEAPVSPDDATAFARDVPVEGRALSSLFPVETVNEETLDFARIQRVNRAAKYRAFDGRVHVTKRDGADSLRVRLMPLSVASGPDGEYALRQREFIRVAGTAQAVLEEAIYDDLDRQVGEVYNRIEMAWGDVLADGILSINEGGLQAEADYGLPSAHNINVIGAGNVWTNKAAPALTKLQEWADRYRKTNGVRAGATRVSPRVQRLLQANEELIAAAVGNAAGRTNINLNELAQVFDAYDIPPLQVVETQPLTVDDAETDVFPDDKVMLTPADAQMGLLGASVFGLTSTALSLVRDARSTLEYEDAAGVVGLVWNEGFPPRETVIVDAIGQPVLKDARRLLVADVV